MVLNVNDGVKKMINNIEVNYVKSNEKYYVFIDEVLVGKAYTLNEAVKEIERVISQEVKE